MQIFLTGAHSTGKTTLAKALAERLGLPLLPEVARVVLREKGLRFPVPPDRVDEVQSEMARRQTRLFDSHVNRDYVSDRYVDFFAYWAVYGGNNMTHRVRFGGKPVFFPPTYQQVTIFHLPPRRNLSVTDDIRGESSFDDALRIDGVLRMLHALWGFKVHHVQAVSVEDRIREVIDAIRRR